MCQFIQITYNKVTIKSLHIRNKNKKYNICKQSY
jgi:hypothetical protein